jgi:transcriptional regulator with XRE-family HTH domain
MKKMDVAKFIRDRFKQARQDKGLSQTQTAQLLGIAQATVSDLENGRIQISAADLYRIGAILDKPIAFFFPAQSEAASDIEAELLNVFRSLSPEWQKRAVYAVNKEARLRERVLPYERAGIPEEHYGWLLSEEEQLMNLDEGADYEPTDEELERGRREYEAFRKYRDTIDARLRAERNK